MRSGEDVLGKIQKVTLYILLSFDKFCRERNLTYFVDSGTALGAVRHGGFIPWDDDIDVGMPRKDYERLLQLGHELPKELFLQTRDTDSSYKRNAAKLRLRGTFCQEAEDIIYNENGFFIDVFPFDNVPNNKYIANFNVFFLGRLHHLITSWWYGGNDSSTFHRIVVKYFFKKIPKSFIEKLNDKFVELCRKGEKYNTRYITSYYWSMTFDHSYLFDSNKMFPVQDILFEGSPVMIMKDYDYYLNKVYGDYMQLPPENKRHGHHLKGTIDFGKYA